MLDRVTLADVAREAGVSRVAAGRVLLGSGSDSVRVSEQVAAEIRRGAQKLGYQPNRSAQRLKGKTGNLIGAVVATDAPEIERVRLVALERIAWERGYQLLISALAPDVGTKDPVESAALLVNQGAAGIIFLTAGIELADNADRFAPLGHAVYCGIPSIIGDAPGVVLDLAHGYRQAARHLAQQGRRKMAVMHIEFPGVSSPYTECFLNAVSAEADSIGGVEVVPCAVTLDPKHRTPSFPVTDQLVTSLLRAGVDAVMTYADMAAARLIQVLSKRGVRVPEDVAVCGMSNLEIAELTSPPLTTIDEQPRVVAEVMFDMMLAQVEGGDDVLKNQCVVRSELVVRESA